MLDSEVLTSARCQMMGEMVADGDCLLTPGLVPPSFTLEGLEIPGCLNGWRLRANPCDMFVNSPD